MTTHVEDYSEDTRPFPMTETRRLREIYVNPEEAEQASAEYARTIIDQQNRRPRPAVEGILAIEAALRNAEPNQAVEAPPEYMDAVLAQRNAIHGDFTDDATTAQALKYIMRKGKNWDDMPPWMCEALDQMQTKIARILAGDYRHPDHWKDLQGYPRLVEIRL
jgi:hypothetical protein